MKPLLLLAVLSILAGCTSLSSTPEPVAPSSTSSPSEPVPVAVTPVVTEMEGSLAQIRAEADRCNGTATLTVIIQDEREYISYRCTWEHSTVPVFIE